MKIIKTEYGSYQGYELSTGRLLDGDSLDLCVSPWIGVSGGEYGFPGTMSEELTPEERREIAEYAIELWKKWGGIE